MFLKKCICALVFVILFCNSCSSQPNSEVKEFLNQFFRLKFNPTEPIAKNLSRVMTVEAEAHKILSPSGRNHALNGHWPRFFNVDERLQHAPHHITLHQLLAERLHSRILKCDDIEPLHIPFPQIDVGRKIHTLQDAKKALDITANNTERDSFINGHFYSFEGKTNKPKVLVTLYTPPKEGEYNRIKWFLPIEQAFLLRNLREYRKTTGILKVWSAHSQLGLAVIPEGTEVSLRVGITSPQTFPNLKELFETYPHEDVTYKSDREKFMSRFQGDTSGYMDLNPQLISMKRTLTREGCTNNDSCIYRFLENLPGGGTQVLFAYAVKDEKSIPIINIDGVYLNDKPFTKVYPSIETDPPIADKSYNGPRYPVWPAGSHLFDSSYDRISLNLSRGLHKNGILNSDEYNDFEAVISEIRAKETCWTVRRGVFDGRIDVNAALRILDREGVHEEGEFGKFRRLCGNGFNFLPS